MTYLAGLIAVVLLVIGFVHFLWGLRIYWPGGDETALARKVVGAAGITAMPAPLQCHLVVLAMIIAAGDALLLGGTLGSTFGPGSVPNWLIIAVGCGGGLVFLLRGVAGFVPAWARLTPEEPFRTLDRRYFAPLCLLLGAGFAALVWQFVHPG